MNDVIYLEPDDEITSVIDRLKLGSTSRAILVIPRGSTLGQSVVNLKILKRSAEEIGKEIVMVAADRIARNLASQIGLAVYSKVSEAERAQSAQPPKISRPEEDNKSDSDLKINTYKRFDDQEEEPLQANTAEDNNNVEIKIVPRSLAKGERLSETSSELPSADEDLSHDPEGVDIEKIRSMAMAEDEEEDRPKTLVPQKEEKMAAARSKAHGSRKPIFSLMAIFLFFIIIFAVIFVPYASASLTLKVADYSKDFDVVADKLESSSNAEKMIIPGKLLEVEKEVTKNYPATGKKDAGEKAKGKITVYNAYDSYAHQYAKGSKFTASGKIFIADASFSVSGATLVGGAVKAGEGSVDVAAEKSGDSYNLESTTYALEGVPSKIYGQGNKMSGGVTREISIVAEEDLDKAEVELKKSAEEEIKQEVINKAKAESSIIFESGLKSEIANTSYSKRVDEEAENFDATLRVKIFGITFLESDLRSVVVESINRQLGDSMMLVNADKAEIGYQIVSNDIDRGTVNIKASFKGKVGEKLSEPELVNLIKNKSLNQARQLLREREGIENAELSTWPSFYKRTPLLVNRIKINFDYAK